MLVVTNGSCTDTTTQIVAIVTGVQELNSQSGISVFQNPVLQNATVTVASDQLKAMMQVMNSLGEMVMQRTIYSKGNRSFQEVIDTRNLPAGAYSIRVQLNDRNLGTRLIKLN
jgi:hypothetical protein